MEHHFLAVFRGPLQGKAKRHLSPVEKDWAVVSSAARDIVKESPLRELHSTTSILVPDAFSRVSRMLPPLGLGKLSPSPDCTVSVVSVSERLDAKLRRYGRKSKVADSPKRGVESCNVQGEFC